MNEFSIIPNYCEIMVHDGWRPNYKYKTAEHTLYCASIFREVVFSEVGKHQQWAEPFRYLSLKMVDSAESRDRLGQKLFSQGANGGLCQNVMKPSGAQGLEANPIQPYIKARLLFPKA